MSWLGKLFGQRSATETIHDADAKWTAKEYGDAKLTYEVARDASDATQDQRDHVKARIVECRDRLADLRLEEASRLAAEGDEQSLELAHAEVNNALEIAASDSVLQRARELGERLERGQARKHAQDLADDETDPIAALAGTWEPEQAEEYEGYDDAFTEALIALQDGRAAEALTAFELIAQTATDAHYLHFEIGRAQLIVGQTDDGAATLHKFLKSIGPDEGGESRLVAHLELATIAKERGDFDGAVAELENAVDALPEDPRPYVSLGVFLRKEGHAAEAIEVLEAAQKVIGEARPDWRVMQELGLAHIATGNTKQGTKVLEDVIQMFASQRLTDLPPDTATALAKQHEADGNKARAADLYSALAHGSDRQNLYDHCFAAGRLLLELDQRSDAKRLLQQATEFARNDAEREAAETLAKSA